MLVITNNPKVKKTLEERNLCAVEYLDVSLQELLIAVRNRIHLGCKLLTHPLSGSIKPNETCCKSIGLSEKNEKSVDYRSLELIEQAIYVCQKFPARFPVLTERLREDFQLVDLTLILSVFQGDVSAEHSKAL